MLDTKKRYRVQLPSAASFDEARRVLSSQAEILVESARRRMIAATDISEDAELRLRSMGARFVEDVRYSMD